MQEIIDYIQSARQSGMAEEAIKNALKSSGWDEGSIEQAFKQVSVPTGSPVSLPAVTPVTPGIVGPGIGAGTTPGHGISLFGKTWKLKSLLVGTGAVVLVAAGGAYAYAYTVNKPVFDLTQYTEKFLDHKPFAVKFEAKGKILPSSSLSVPSGMDLSGDFEVVGSVLTKIGDESNTGKALGSYNVKAKDNSFNLEVRLPKFNMCGTPGDVYFKINTDSPLAKAPQFAQVLDKWIKIDQDFYEQMSQTYGSTSTGSECAYQQIQQLVDEQIKDFQKHAEESKKAVNILLKKILIKQADETIENISSRHYRVDLTKKEAYLEFSNAMNKIWGYKAGAGDQEVATALDEANKNGISIEIWIGKKTQLFKVKLTGKIEVADGYVAFTVFEHDDFSVDIPTGSLDIKELLQPFLSALQGGMTGLPVGSENRGFETMPDFNSLPKNAFPPNYNPESF